MCISPEDTSDMEHFWRKLIIEEKAGQRLGYRIVFQFWIITAPSENSLFPVLEWLFLCGYRPNNRPHWLALAFLPPWTVAAVTLSGSVAFSAALVNTHCTVDFKALSSLAYYLISQHTPSMTCDDYSRCVFYLFIATTQLCKHINDRIDFRRRRDDV